MANIKIKNLNKGFTLIEVLVIMALLGIIASFGLFMSLDSYKSSSFRNERDTLVSALMHARAQAINNVCISTSSAICTDGKSHGVHIERENPSDVNSPIKEYVVFQGNTYNLTDQANETIQTNYLVSDIGATDVYFNQLSGNVSAVVVLQLRGGVAESSDITIGTEGQISWTN